MKLLHLSAAAITGLVLLITAAMAAEGPLDMQSTELLTWVEDPSASPVQGLRFFVVNDRCLVHRVMVSGLDGKGLILTKSMDFQNEATVIREEVQRGDWFFAETLAFPVAFESAGQALDFEAMFHTLAEAAESSAENGSEPAGTISLQTTQGLHHEVDLEGDEASLTGLLLKELEDSPWREKARQQARGEIQAVAELQGMLCNKAGGELCAFDEFLARTVNLLQEEAEPGSAAPAAEEASSAPAPHRETRIGLHPSWPGAKFWQGLDSHRVGPRDPLAGTCASERP